MIPEESKEPMVALGKKTAKEIQSALNTGPPAQTV